MTEGPERAIRFFKKLGFDTVISPKARERLEKLKKKYDFLCLPLFQPKSHQLLAYFKDKTYKAIETVKDKEGKVLFFKDRTYAIRPHWIRNMQEVKVENVINSQGKEVRKTTSLDRGYLAIEVKSEQGEIQFNEPETEQMKLFIQAFGLPKIKSLDDRRTGKSHKVL